MLGLSRLVELSRAFRLVWLGGRYGSYKTALAFRLAMAILDRYSHYRFWSNCPNFIADWPHTTIPDFYSLVVVADEGGAILNRSRDAEALLLGLRKRDVVFLLPSFEPPPSFARVCSVYMYINLYDLSLPFALFEIVTQSVDKFRERILVDVRPALGVYDTDYLPLDSSFVKSFSDSLVYGDSGGDDVVRSPESYDSIQASIDIASIASVARTKRRKGFGF